MIKQEKNIEKLKVSLNLFEDSDNILRIKSRIAQNDETIFSWKFPILLRNDSYFTKLVIYNFHECVYHNGTEATLNGLRTEYWVIRSVEVWKIQSVERVLKECIICEYVNKLPAQPLATPELPDYRVQCNLAFEVVVIDYPGPLFSSNDDVYKCYFYCLPVRLAVQYI